MSVSVDHRKAVLFGKGSVQALGAEDSELALPVDGMCSVWWGDQAGNPVILFREAQPSQLSPNRVSHAMTPLHWNGPLTPAGECQLDYQARSLPSSLGQTEQKKSCFLGNLSMFQTRRPRQRREKGQVPGPTLGPKRPVLLYFDSGSESFVRPILSHCRCLSFGHTPLAQYRGILAAPQIESQDSKAAHGP